MKRYFLFGALLFLIAWSLFGCAGAVRYSPEEIGEYPPAVQENIRQGVVAIGMIPQQVRFAWGPPSTINILSPTEDGKRREEWIYSTSIFFEKRVLFIEGKVADIFPEPKRPSEIKQDEKKDEEKK